MREIRFQKIGWLLFLLCSIVYSYDAWRNKNTVGIIGGALFFLGCLVFMYPLFISPKEKELYRKKVTETGNHNR